ncbi:hypothetical protein SODALDRAFT_323760 [Sodiomyces alkalinus F11]|uniref:Uncharacterized protein n=1 Tax=Sodiomyces alkalinus (strain CBS 110278 / VKM F-3762 / F11) TaxID=1314773 RepID=A0A3N2PY72_SODAK|nr:hypothetical protein SODALDRAFT_323760 [Sodiomyces alkalinus F11]ROT39366.1 hypothetical protein SODALDRAFT_323760 [Sodiomyces alkalinus F11]
MPKQADYGYLYRHLIRQAHNRKYLPKAEIKRRARRKSPIRLCRKINGTVVSVQSSTDCLIFRTWQAREDSVERLNTAMSMGHYKAVDLARHISSTLETEQVPDDAPELFHIWDISQSPSNDPVLRPFDTCLPNAVQRRLVMASSRRLQAAAGVFNENIFRLPGVRQQERLPYQIMDIEPPAPRCSALDAETSFRGLFERSNASGYRMMTLASIHFQVPYSTLPFPLECHHPQRELPLQTGAHLRATKEGSITVFELNIDACVWFVFEMNLPLAEVEGHCPPELEPMPMSCLRLAVPKDKVTTRTTPAPPTPDIEPQRARQRLELCRDSIPLFVTGSKNLYIPSEHHGVEDFFQATKVTGMACRWRDKKTKKWAKRREKFAFWKDFQRAAQLDKTQWTLVQEAMARGQCVVDMDILEPWRDVPRTKTAPTDPLSRNSHQATPLSPKGHPEETPDQRRKQQRSSGLRNEVKF